MVTKALLFFIGILVIGSENDDADAIKVINIMMPI